MIFNVVKDKKKILLAALVCAVFTVLFIALGLDCTQTKADRLFPSFYSTDGSSCADISDADYFTSEYFDPGTQITISSDTPIDSIYIVWEKYPGTWTLSVNGRDYTYGTEGYLHEYVKLPEGTGNADSVTLSVGSSRITIADIYAFSKGTLPDFVQKWEPSYDKADILFVSTHADDEELFFGGLIPNYIDRGDVRVQLAYFTDLFQSESYRNHEILNGLWTMGVTHYPQFGEFYDNYSESYDEAKQQYNYKDGLDYMIRTIRRFKPQVVVGQDIVNGEYGHGGHIWCSRLIADALELTGDEESFPDSAKTYGTWDVPKTYFHLYPEKTVEIDDRVPLASFGQKSALEVAKLAYQEHKSQQWTWFYVSDGYDDEGNPDGYEYSCTKYGLYRSLVGDDHTGTDILDNIVTYDEQYKLAQLEEESESDSSSENIKNTKSDSMDQTRTAPAERVLNDSNITAVPGGRNTTALTIFIVLAIIVAVIIVGIIVLARIERKEKARKRLERKRKMMAGKTGAASGRSSASAGRRTVKPAQPVKPQTPRTRTSSASSAAGRTRQSTPSAAGRVSRSSNGTYSSDRTRR